MPMPGTLGARLRAIQRVRSRPSQTIARKRAPTFRSDALFRRPLSSFPLVPAPVKAAALAAFRRSPV